MDNNKKINGQIIISIISAFIVLLGIIIFFLSEKLIGNIITSDLGNGNKTIYSSLGLANILGGETDSMLTFFYENGELIKEEEIFLTLNFNYLYLIDLFVLSLGFILFLGFYKVKICQVIATLVLILSSILILGINGTTYYSISNPTLMNDLLNAGGKVTVFNIGLIVLGITSLITAAISLIHTIIVFVKK